MSKLLENIRKRQLILTHIRHNYKDFIITKAKTLANQIILDEIQNRMRAENFSNKIVDRTYVSKVEFIDNETLRINIKSDFKAESGFAVAVARELGTDVNKAGHRHFIKLKIKLALSWISQGKRMFSRGHYVSGLKSLKIMETTIREKKPVLIKALQNSLEEWKNHLMSNVK